MSEIYISVRCFKTQNETCRVNRAILGAARMRNSTYPCVSVCAPSGASSWYTLCRSPRRHTGELCAFANCRHSRVRRWGKRTHCAYRSAQQSYYWDSLQAVCGRP